MIDWNLLLAALIAVESGGRVDTIGDGGKAVGCLQIHEVYVKDCNRIMRMSRYAGPVGTGFTFMPEDRLSESPSRCMTVWYLRHYGEQYRRVTGREPSYEVYARIHNGGPTGYRRAATEPYWAKVEAALGQIRRNKTK